MALIRGGMGYMPCPVCTVPYDSLSDLSQQYPLRTTDSMQKIYQEAIKMNATMANDHLKVYGL